MIHGRLVMLHFSWLVLYADNMEVILFLLTA
nr:MAG TPA: hypothetical protein [Caudoviricetes sp.]